MFLYYFSVILLILCTSEFLVTVEARSVCSISWDWNYSWFRATTWALGIVPGSSGRTRLLTAEPLLLPQRGFILRDTLKAHTCHVFTPSPQTMTVATHVLDSIHLWATLPGWTSQGQEWPWGWEKKESHSSCHLPVKGLPVNCLMPSSEGTVNVYYPVF